VKPQTYFSSNKISLLEFNEPINRKEVKPIPLPLGEGQTVLPINRRYQALH
jgi:hypothetical protein